jgi:hypothetical protein
LRCFGWRVERGAEVAFQRCYYQATGDPTERRGGSVSARLSGGPRAIRIPNIPAFYFDLADEHWRAVEIGPDGWRVVPSLVDPNAAPVRALPREEGGGRFSAQTLNTLPTSG